MDLAQAKNSVRALMNFYDGLRALEEILGITESQQSEVDALKQVKSSLESEIDALGPVKQALLDVHTQMRGEIEADRLRLEQGRAQAMEALGTARTGQEQAEQALADYLAAAAIERGLIVQEIAARQADLEKAQAALQAIKDRL